MRWPCVPSVQVWVDVCTRLSLACPRKGQGRESAAVVAAEVFLKAVARLSLPPAGWESSPCSASSSARVIVRLFPLATLLGARGRSPAASACASLLGNKAEPDLTGSGSAG